MITRRQAAGALALLVALAGCTTESSPDAPPKPEAGPPSSDASQGGPSDAAVDVYIGCDPANVTAFEPPAYVPAIAHQDVCSADDIAVFLSSCVTASGNQTCAQWEAANVASDAGSGTRCGDCIAPRQNGGAVWYDPLGLQWPNYAGCMELSDAVHGPACARAYANANACKTFACDHVCGQMAPECPSLNACDTCYGNAVQDGCGAYEAAEQTACSADFADGGALDTCSAGGPVDSYARIVLLMCGSADGG